MGMEKGCITDQWRGILANMIQSDAEKPIILGVLNHIPRCEDSMPMAKTGKPAGEEVKRKQATLWPSPAFYINEKGEKIEYSSPSAMWKDLTGQGVSAQVCVMKESGEVKCHANSLIDNFAQKGYVIRGNGEPAPVSKDELTDSQNLAESERWKQHLIETGKKFTVFHPNAPELKAAGASAEKKTTTTKKK